MAFRASLSASVSPSPSPPSLPLPLSLSPSLSSSSSSPPPLKLPLSVCVPLSVRSRAIWWSDRCQNLVERVMAAFRRRIGCSSVGSEPRTLGGRRIGLLYIYNVQCAYRRACVVHSPRSYSRFKSRKSATFAGSNGFAQFWCGFRWLFWHSLGCGSRVGVALRDMSVAVALVHCAARRIKRGRCLSRFCCFLSPC